MQEQALNKLSGQIEGISRTLMLLIAELGEDRVIDHDFYTDSLRRAANELDQKNRILDTARQTMHLMADQLDQAWVSRRTQTQ